MHINKFMNDLIKSLPTQIIDHNKVECEFEVWQEVSRGLELPISGVIFSSARNYINEIVY